LKRGQVSEIWPKKGQSGNPNLRLHAKNWTWVNCKLTTAWHQKQWTWLLCSVSVVLAPELSLQEIHQLQ